MIDRDGRQIFEQKHLENDEIPKIFPFTKFNVKNVLGDFEMDPSGEPILEKDKKGGIKDNQGRKVNKKGYLIDKDGNVVDKKQKVMFKVKLLDNEGDIPKVFRTGLLKSDTASSLSRLMSEIERNQPSDFDKEEEHIQEEMKRNMKGRAQGQAGDTSSGDEMGETPANYNAQNQAQQKQGQRGDQPTNEDLEEYDMEDDSEYGDEMGQGMDNGRGQLVKKKKKKKKKQKRPVEMEDPSIREHLLAGAYGGIAKPKPKR